jgi:hypothetical protein
LWPGQICELSGRSEWSETMNTSRDEVVAEVFKYLRKDFA